MASNINITPTSGEMHGRLIIANSFPIVGMMHGQITTRRGTFPTVGMMHGQLVESNAVAPRWGVMHGSLSVCLPFWSETYPGPSAFTETVPEPEYICSSDSSAINVAPSVGVLHASMGTR